MDKELAIKELENALDCLDKYGKIKETGSESMVKKAYGLLVCKIDNLNCVEKSCSMVYDSNKPKKRTYKGE